MNPKIEKQLNKIKQLDDLMVDILEQLRIQKELVLNSKEKETSLFNETNIIENGLRKEKDILFEMMRSEK